MADRRFIKTTPAGIVIEYHEYQNVADDFAPSSDHVALDALPAAHGSDLVGRTYDATAGTFSAEKAPGFEDEDPG